MNEVKKGIGMPRCPWCNTPLRMKIINNGITFTLTCPLCGMEFRKRIWKKDAFGIFIGGKRV